VSSCGRPRPWAGGTARSLPGVRPLHVVHESFPGDPALDAAVSRATLERVAAGELAETLRVARPGRVVAFAKRDALSPGYAEAVAAARGAGPPAGAGGRGAAAPGEPCGQQISAPPASAANGISHDGQTETYVIISGGGTLVTGGRIANGRRSAPDSDVTRILNGPSCSGIIAGPDVVSKQVKTGDVIIIPAGVPHGWSEIPDHVDYLSVRPDPDRVLPRDYVNPAIRK